jgi:hypothetical protein
MMIIVNAFFAVADRAMVSHARSRACSPARIAIVAIPAGTAARGSLADLRYEHRPAGCLIQIQAVL